jgi:glycosylphosphatidylinositol transamidase
LDIIFVVLDQGIYGQKAWLDSYHGFAPQGTDVVQLKYSNLENRAGAIRSAINLDFSQKAPYNSVGLFPEGVNGRLSNADLITTVVKSFSYEGIPVYLHGNAQHPSFDDQVGTYMLYATNLLHYLKNQALGFPVADHGLFLNYKIEAVTVAGVSADLNDREIAFDQIGRSFEGIARSINNVRIPKTAFGAFSSRLLVLFDA